MPIANAKVEIYKNDVLIATGYTDADGKYTYPLEAGDYRIVISKTGYNTVTKEETIGTRTQLVVNLPESAYGLPLDKTVSVTLLKDYTLSSTDKTVSVGTTIETVVG